MDKEIFFELATGFWVNLSAYYFVQISVYSFNGDFVSLVGSVAAFIILNTLAYASRRELKKLQ